LGGGSEGGIEPEERLGPSEALAQEGIGLGEHSRQGDRRRQYA